MQHISKLYIRFTDSAAWESVLRNIMFQGGLSKTISFYDIVKSDSWDEYFKEFFANQETAEAYLQSEWSSEELQQVINYLVLSAGDNCIVLGSSISSDAAASESCYFYLGSGRGEFHLNQAAARHHRQIPMSNIVKWLGDHAQLLCSEQDTLASFQKIPGQRIVTRNKDMMIAGNTPFSTTNPQNAASCRISATACSDCFVWLPFQRELVHGVEVGEVRVLVLQQQGQDVDSARLLGNLDELRNLSQGKTGQQ